MRQRGGLVVLGVMCALRALAAPIPEHVHVTTSGERTTLDRATGKLVSTVEVTLFNLGGRTLATPFHAAVNLTMSSGTVAQVEMPGASGGPGQAPYSTFYVDLSPQFPQRTVAPNATAQTVLTFVRDRDVRFTYRIDPHAELVEARVPRLVIDPLAFAVDEGETLSIPVAGDDGDGDVVTLAGEPAISNATFVVSNGVAAAGLFTFTPAYDQEGEYAVTFSARDPLGLTTSLTARITVNDVNRSPLLAGPSTASVREGDVLKLTLTADDPDGDPVNITAIGLPTNALFISETATLYFAPDFNQAGSYDLRFEADDGDLPGETQAVAVAVTDVSLAAPGDTNALTLIVDAVASPTLLGSQRLTGAVNSTGGTARLPATMALITGVSPASGEQGQTLDVTLTGQAAGLFATHFGEGSRADFGTGIQLDSLTVSNAALAVARITIAGDAAAGPRGVQVDTVNEVAVSLVAFNVRAGDFAINGTLIDATVSNAIANAIITLQGTGYSTVSGADGSFSFNGLPPGDYTLLINPPNHEPIAMPFQAIAGQNVALGLVPTAATVFDPSAPAGVSLLSVLGRGLGGGFGSRDPQQNAQLLTDAILLCGGSEAGVLDAYGVQLNAAVVGEGLVNLMATGVRQQADRMARGESVSLTETLYAFSFAFTWTNGPPLTMAEWLDGMQTMVNRAWAAPNNPSNMLPLLVFNRGRTLLKEPPQLTPVTRLNPAQNYLLIASLLSTMTDPAGTNLQPLARGFQGSSQRRGSPPPAQSWTGYWRGFSGVKGNFISTQLNSAVSRYAELTGFMTVLACTGDLTVNLLALPITGILAGDLANALGAVAMSGRVPEAPRMLRTEVVPGPQGAPRVKVHFRRSVSDKRDGRSLYMLWRFRGPHEPRHAVQPGFFDAEPGQELVITDLGPFPGSTFYAVTLTRLFSPDEIISESELKATEPWWNATIDNLANPLAQYAAARQRLVSDYSDPGLVYVGSPAAAIPVNDIEINPLSSDVYYALRATNIHEQQILRIPDLGRGEPASFAAMGFAAPGFDGLAVDSEGNLYSHNKASDALFGGRLFRFAGADGARTHAGQINYFSRDLQFARPVDGQIVDIGPGLSPTVSDEDVYTVDMLAGEIKQVPVKATYDPYRRVGQPYAALPLTGRVMDMEHDVDGNTFLLLADANPRLPFLDFEKGNMHIPPGAPISQDCPPEETDGHVDPVYLFSGEFYHDEEDIRIKGRGLDFIWTRKYRSKIPFTTEQGNQWDYSYNIYVTTNADRVVVHDGHTRVDEYLPSGTNGVWTLSEFFRELTREPDGSYTLEFEDKGAWRFRGFTGTAADGKIAESIDRHGNRLAFFYDAQGRLDRVNDTLNRDITITYGSDGFINGISDFAGRLWRYEYCGASDPDGNPGDLKAFIRPAVTGTPNGNDFPFGKRTSYTYSKGAAEARLNGNLLTITDGRRNDTNDVTFGRGPWLRNVYAAAPLPTDPDFDRLTRQVWGDPSDVIDLVYAPVTPTPANGGAVAKTIINDRNGHVKEYWHDGQNRVVIRREFTGTALKTQPTTETGNRPVGRLRADDPVFFETRYEWNADGLKRREFHPNGNYTEWVYEADMDPAAPARSRGNVREIRHYPGTHVPAGDQAVIVEAFEYDTSYGRGCCGFNFVTRHVDGRGGVELKFYDSTGNLTSIVHRVATSREDYAYNSAGQMIAVTGPDYGNGQRRVDHFDYYGPADGHQNGYLRRKIVDVGGLNLTMTYHYDAVGNIVQLVDHRGKDQHFVINALNQTVRTLSAEIQDGSGIRYVTDHFYDANDNLVRTEVVNRDETGALDAANPSISVAQEFDILNMTTREAREVEPGREVVVERVYDGNRNLVLTRSGEAVNGQSPADVVRTAYDERDKPYRVVSAPGSAEQHTAQWDYDANGNLVRVAVGLEQNPRLMSYVFDGFDRQVRQTDNTGNVGETTFDANSQAVLIRQFGELADGPGSSNNVRLVETRIAYDAMNRATNTTVLRFDPVTQVAIGDGRTVSWTVYTDTSRPARTVDDNGRAVRHTYDALDRPLSTVDEDGNVQTRVYDPNGNVLVTQTVEVPDAGGPGGVFVVSNAYDNLNRLVRSVENGLRTNTIAYNSRNLPVVTTDPRGNRSRVTYDGLGRALRMTRTLTADGTGGGVVAGAVETTQHWDDNSRLMARTDGGSNTTVYAYDARGRLLHTTMADGRTEVQTYDIHSNVLTQRDANGTVVSNRYDGLDRVVRRDYSPGPGVATNLTFEAYTYDGLSRSVRAERDGAVVTRAYDSQSRVQAETLNGRTTRYTYDDMGNLLAWQYPGGLVVSNQFDALDRLREVSDSQGPVASFGYLGPVREWRRTFGNNTRVTRNYDGLRRTTHSTLVRDPTGAATVLEAWHYGWDAANNKTSRVEVVAGQTHQYRYDSANRMVRAESAGSGVTTYGLDAAGNRQTVAGGPASGSYGLSAVMPEPADRQVNQYTTTSFDARTYDANGNLTAINAGQPDARTFRYDANNALVEFHDGASGRTAYYDYDAQGRRIGRRVSGAGGVSVRYFYEGDRIIEEQSTNGTTVATYAFGNGPDDVLLMRRGGQAFFYHADDLGNITKVTDAAGAVVEQYAYDDYGRPQIRTGGGAPLASSAIGNPFLFQGREYDAETGFYFFRSRYYDPRAGRFVARDRAGPWHDGGNAGNAYTFLGNNPWNGTDPQGHSKASYVGGFIYGGMEWGANTVQGLASLVTSTRKPTAMDAIPGYAMAESVGKGLSGFWNACEVVAADPNGISYGWFRMLFPGFVEKQRCWEYISEFDRGRAWGQITPDLVLSATGAYELTAAGKGAILARLGRGRTFGAASVPAAAGGGLAEDARRTRMIVDELIKENKGLRTDLAIALQTGDVSIQFVHDVNLKWRGLYEGYHNVATRNTIKLNTAYISSIEEAASTGIHEFKHLLDKIQPGNYTKAHEAAAMMEEVKAGYGKVAGYQSADEVLVKVNDFKHRNYQALPAGNMGWLLDMIVTK